MMRIFCLLGIVLEAITMTSLVQAQERVALVIGNSAYQHAPRLTNPQNDAADMMAVLKKLSFRIIDGFDLDKNQFDKKIREFAGSLKGAKVGLFFYAGHGLQVGGKNYLVPVDAQVESEAALDFELVQLDLVLRSMEREAATNILLVDACRNNPLARNLSRAMGTRSVAIGRGLAATEGGIGTLISFSTQPGNVALDGVKRNSPYAGAFIRHVGSSADDLNAILIAVRNDVIKETERAQVPWEHSALTGRFYFNQSSDNVSKAIQKAGEVLPVKSTSHASNQDEVSRFSWQTDPNETQAGTRNWVKQPDSSWIEHYTNGKESIFMFRRRLTLRNCDGVLLEKTEEPGFEVFVPDKTCVSMNAFWRRGKGTWVHLGLMNDIH